MTFTERHDTPTARDFRTAVREEFAPTLEFWRMAQIVEEERQRFYRSQDCVIPAARMVECQRCGARLDAWKGTVLT